MKNVLPLQKIILTGLLLMQLYSCAPPLYFPNGINAPLFSKKGQFAMNVAASGNLLSGNSYDIQMATSTSEKFGVLLNINFSDFENRVSVTTSNNGSWVSNSSYPYWHKHFFYEGGAGIYDKIGNHGRTETFVLVGFGSASSYGSGIEKTASYMRFAIQSDIGIETEVFEGIFSCRMGYLNLNGHYSNYNNNSNYIYIDPTSFFVDPAITLRFGFKGFKLFTQLGLSLAFNGSNEDWNPGWGSFGLQMRF